MKVEIKYKNGIKKTYSEVINVIMSWGDILIYINEDTKVIHMEDVNGYKVYDL